MVVQTWKEMEAGCTPKLESWRCSLKMMGFEISMVAAGLRKSTEGGRRAVIVVYDLSFDRGRWGERRGRRLVGCEFEALEGYVALNANLYLFVRLPPRSREIPILLYRIIGLAHPKDVVTERREVKIYQCATPTRQSPAAIPGDIDQSTGFCLFA